MPGPGRVGNCPAVGGEPGRVLGSCEAPGLNQSGIEGRWPEPEPIPLWILSRSILGRVPALGADGRVLPPGRVDGSCPVDGRLGVEGRVDGNLPVEGRLGVAGRLTEGRLGVAGRLTEGFELVDGRLIDGDRLAEGRAPPLGRPPPRPPR